MLQIVASLHIKASPNASQIQATPCTSYFQVLLVVPSADTLMHILPTEEQEMQGRTNYGKYVSPDADNATLGSLAARTVRDVGTNLFDHVKRIENPMAVAPISKIEIPCVKTFSYIVATDEANNVGACVCLMSVMCIPPPKKHTPTHPHKTQKLDHLVKTNIYIYIYIYIHMVMSFFAHIQYMVYT